MAIQLSPGVQVVEKDFSQIIPQVSTTRGAFAGNFRWGPVLEPTLITSQSQLVNQFLSPDNETFESFYTASNFLDYSNNLIVTRVDTGPSRNASALLAGGIGKVDITNNGIGYTSVPKVFFDNPAAQDGTNAEAIAEVSGGPINTYTITTGGTGYVTGQAVTFPRPDVKTLNSAGVKTYQTATGTITASAGVITGVTITNAGNGYIGNIVCGVTSVAGVNAILTFVPYASTITNIKMTNVGNGYTLDQNVQCYIEVLPELQNVPVTTEAIGIPVVYPTGAKVLNASHYLNTVSSTAGLTAKGEFVAKYPGALGNTLGVSMCDAGGWSISGAGTIYARSSIQTGEDQRELITVRISGSDHVYGATTNKLKAGKIIRTATEGAEKLIGQIRTVDEKVKYYKVTLVNDANVELSSQQVVVGDLNLVIGDVTVGYIDGLHKQWNDLDNQYDLSTKTFYIRMINQTATVGAKVVDLDRTPVYTGALEGAVLKNYLNVSIGQIETAEEITVVYLKSRSPNDSLQSYVDELTTIPGEYYNLEWEYKNRFGRAPGTSAFAAANNGSNDELHVIVFDALGKLAPVGTVIEQYAFLSKGFDGKIGGKNNYYKDVINSSSRWIWWTDHPNAAETASRTISAFNVKLAPKNISSFVDNTATTAGTVKVISANHNLLTDDYITISEASGYSSVIPVKITKIDDNSFSIVSTFYAGVTYGNFSLVNRISAFANYNATIAGTVKVTSLAHGLTTGMYVNLVATGYTSLAPVKVTKIDADNFYYTGTWGATAVGYFTINYVVGRPIHIRNLGTIKLSRIGQLGFAADKTWNGSPFTVNFSTSVDPTVYYTIEAHASIGNVMNFAQIEETHVPFGSSVVDNAFVYMENVLTRYLSGGIDTKKSQTGNNNLIDAYSLYAHDDLYDISLLPLGNASAYVINWVIQNVAEKRKDCVAFASAPLHIGTGANIPSAIVNFRNQVVSSSYGVMDSTWKYQYDKYADKYRWIPANGDTAGLCARTDEVADAWFSPGGFNRGILKNVIKLAFNPNQAQRDELYKNGINPIVAFPGQGTVLYGDKTLLRTASAFDRINVRRLFIVLEKAISAATKYQLFEFNDAFTRGQFKNMVEPFLRDVQGRRGIYEFAVKCDDSNNTATIIDSNQFVADIYIKPARSINFITLNFIAAKTGASFQELGL